MSQAKTLPSFWSVVVRPKWQLLKAENPERTFRDAWKAFRKAAEFNSGTAVPLMGMAEYFYWLAQSQKPHITQARASVQEGLQKIGEALKIQPLGEAYALQSMLFFLEADLTSDPKQKDESIRRAEGARKQMLALNKNIARFYSPYLTVN